MKRDERRPQKFVHVFYLKITGGLSLSGYVCGMCHSPNEQLILDVVKGLRLPLSIQGSGVDLAADKELDNVLLTYDLDPQRVHGP